MADSNQKTSGLHRWAVFTALATLGLIGMGGLVTSHGVGMAVPDWPTTYGYNMFLFPISQWVGGIFYEHSHRLWASAVGLFTIILMVWAWVHRADPDRRRRLRWLTGIALAGVILQGVLGGLRVVLYKDEVGIIHATLAQLFLVLVCFIALYTSRWWDRFSGLQGAAELAGRRYWILGLTLVVLGQLILGAAMRHQHAGLAVPDFPLAYGKLWPPTDPAFLGQVNQQRMDTRDFKDITAFQIHLHMIHRLTAVSILMLAGGLAVNLIRRLGWFSHAALLALGWFAMVCCQATLGAWTVWSNKAADVATLHVALGATTLVYGSLLSVVSFRLAAPNVLPASCRQNHRPKEGHAVVDSKSANWRTDSPNAWGQASLPATTCEK